MCDLSPQSIQTGGGTGEGDRASPVGHPHPNPPPSRGRGEERREFAIKGEIPYATKTAQIISGHSCRTSDSGHHVGHRIGLNCSGGRSIRISLALVQCDDGSQPTAAPRVSSCDPPHTRYAWQADRAGSPPWAERRSQDRITPGNDSALFAETGRSREAASRHGQPTARRGRPPQAARSMGGIPDASYRL